MNSKPTLYRLSDKVNLLERENSEPNAFDKAKIILQKKLIILRTLLV